MRYKIEFLAGEDYEKYEVAKIGDVYGVMCNAVKSGEIGEAYTDGFFGVPCAADEHIKPGQYLFYDRDNKQITAKSTGIPIGIAYGESLPGAVNVSVKINASHSLRNENQYLKYECTESVVSGQVIVCGSILGVALENATEGSKIDVAVSGVYELECISGEINQGDKVYYDPNAKKITGTESNNMLAGYAWKKSPAKTTTVKVKLLY